MSELLYEYVGYGVPRRGDTYTSMGRLFDRSRDPKPNDTHHYCFRRVEVDPTEPPKDHASIPHEVLRSLVGNLAGGSPSEARLASEVLHSYLPKRRTVGEVVAQAMEWRNTVNKTMEEAIVDALRAAGIDPDQEAQDKEQSS